MTSSTTASVPLGKQINGLWVKLWAYSSPRQQVISGNLYSYDPYNREPTPEEKLEAMAKNQDEDKQQSSSPKKTSGSKIWQ
ncbi:hypothetical protein H6F75_25990 [Nodosilinea sp. FACHB-131]|uniref:hypothetical protein n=1 Tax=Cyanophyceae TaxID=3028117 RepID=UPI001681F034|nr:hypothetical protein [Nodosilinea sp. FACHB-131]MBD1876941.1 hypothetical protein [Nodosilinea sp. FACHB-131]